MLKLLSSLLGRGGQTASAASARQRMAIDALPSVAYAIGDVHGHYDLLRAMEDAVVADSRDIEGDKLIVVLGDVIDRGPESRRVVEHLLRSPPQGFRRVVLAGNHEQMLLDFLDDPSARSLWLDLGGAETLLSYGLRSERVLGRGARPAQMVSDMHALMPAEHIDWLRDLPVLLSLPGYVLVHAGVEPGVLLDDQRDDTLLWLRWDQPGVAPMPGQVVIHGHVPADEPVVEAGRICVDSGAFATGILSAVRLAPNEAPRIVQVRS